jgi:hypothetical protein
MKNGTLKDLIDRINASQIGDEDNEVFQITQILNNHYNQLEWIESQYQLACLGSGPGRPKNPPCFS